jgi:hypothetical protein
MGARVLIDETRYKWHLKSEAVMLVGGVRIGNKITIRTAVFLTAIMHRFDRFAAPSTAFA